MKSVPEASRSKIAEVQWETGVGFAAQEYLRKAIGEDVKPSWSRLKATKGIPR